MRGSKRVRRGLWSALFLGLLITIFAAESNTTIVTASSISGKEILEGVIVHVADAAGSQVIEDSSGYRFCLVGADDGIRRQLEAQAFAEYSRRVASAYLRAPDSTATTQGGLARDLDHVTRVRGEASSFGGCADPATGADLQIFLVHAIVSEQGEILGRPDDLVVAAPEQTAATRPRGAALVANPPPPCEERVASDLLPLLTKEFGISPDYAPDDLTPLADHAPSSLRIGQSVLVREVIVEPLVAMLEEMLATGLQPLVHSAYRDYRTQVTTYRQWTRLYPERGPFLSAPAGHSEHQLGTTLDFGSPELAKFVGSQVRFHPDFAKTREGLWLQEHAHEFGFTLSYPDQATHVTGYYYEPWHYRFVGVEIATMLYEERTSLTEHLSTTQPAPCTP